jgi:hypothetical protein
MYTWYRRHYPDGNYDQTFDLFEKLYVDLGAPKDMFMISDRSVRSATVYISIPEHLRTAFHGFEPIANEDLPNRRAFLIGRGLEFERLFGHGKAFVCNVCHLEARKAMIADEPTVLFDDDIRDDICVERSLAPEPFKCPNLHSAAIGAGVIGTDGDWIQV